MKRTTFVVTSLAVLALHAQAAVLYKDVTTTDLNTVANWSTTYNSATPDPASIGTGDELWFNNMFAPTSGTTYTNSLSSNLTVGSVRSDYGNGSSGVAFGNVVIAAGNTLTLNGTGDASYTDAGIVLNSGTGGTLTINSNLALGASQRWVTSRALTVNGNVSLGANTLSFHTAGSTVTVKGIISGTGGISKINSAGGDTVLSGANTYSGGTNLGIGTLRVAGGPTNTALGTGALTVSGNSTLATANGGGMNIVANAVAINSGVALSADAGYADLFLAGVVSGSGSFKNASTGNVFLVNTANSFSGGTTVATSGTIWGTKFGTLAGDNTILMIVRTAEEVDVVLRRIDEMLR